MSKQTINLGTAPTGVGGDTPRSAFTKAQSNFDELYTALGASGSPAALPPALPIAKGGTGNATGTATKLAAAAMVGTVSQSGGLPTGALQEYVTNGNGEAWKFANGLLICSRYFSSPIAFTIPPGTTAQSGAFALPVPAVGTGVKSYTGYATDAGTNLVGSSWIDFFGGLGWKFQVSNLSTTVTVTQLIAIQFIYVGRWF
jgi:hypothetical protein